VSGILGRDLEQKTTRYGRIKDMGLGDLGNLGNLDLGQVQQFLQGVNFPAQKEEVASNAESNNAPQELVEQIRNSGKDNFNSVEEVLQTVQGGR
jgi:hypothetical protein